MNLFNNIVRKNNAIDNSCMLGIWYLAGRPIAIFSILIMALLMTNKFITIEKPAPYVGATPERIGIIESWVYNPNRVTRLTQNAINLSNSQTPTVQPETLTAMPPTLTPTLTPSRTPTLTPSQTPTATINPLFLTSTMEIEQYRIERAKQAIDNEYIALERKRNIEIETTKFRVNAITGITLCGSGVIILAMMILVIKRVRKEIAVLEGEVVQARITQNPELAYPATNRDEIRLILSLIADNIVYYQAKRENPLTQITIRGFRDCKSLNSKQWVDATDSLVKHGYAMKSQGRETILKIINLGDLRAIVYKGWFYDRDAITKLNGEK